MNFVVATSGDPLSLAGTVRRQVWGIDGTLPVSGLQPMTEVMGDAMARTRFLTSLLAAFAGLALLLAAVGTYGVMSYAVTQRGRELGTSSHVVTMVGTGGSLDPVHPVLLQSLRWWPMNRSMLGPVTLFIVLGMSALAVSPSDAQVVEGTVVDAQNNRPIAGAVVRLTDLRDENLVAAASDDAGRYRITGPAPGRYRLRVEQLGYEVHTSEPVDLTGSDQPVRVDLRLRAAPIPIRGVEVTDEQMSRRLRQFFGMSPGQLRHRPVRRSVIADHSARGNDLSEMMSWLQIPSFQVLRSREGPCFQVRNRGCLPIYLDGARLSRSSTNQLPLEMLGTVVVVLPNEIVAYPDGAVHLFTLGFMR